MPEGSSAGLCSNVGDHTVCTRVDDDDPSCITIDGVKSCYSDAGGVCDTPECFASADRLLKQPDGTGITNSENPSPPAPDNGTPGERANPDMQFGIQLGQWNAGLQFSSNGGSSGWAGSGGGGNGHRMDYFGQSTMEGSSDGGDGDGDGDGDCEGDDCGDKDSISGGTNCTNPPNCSGNPIDCFNARKQWQIWCQTQAPSDSDLNNAINDGLTMNGQTLGQYLDQGTMDASSWLELPESNACSVQDITINLWLTEVTVPLSEFCALFSTIGLFVLAGATLQSIRIIVSGLG